MVQVLKANPKPSFSSQLGAGIGNALPEVINKEVDRYRLSKGLQDLSQTEGLTPFERFAKFSSIPGVTPQMIQSGTNLLMQQDRAKSLKDMQNQPSPFSEQITQQAESEYPHITNYGDLEKGMEGYIPPTKQQELARAGELYNQNPAQFMNDPQKAIDFVGEETARNQQIAEAYQTRHANLTAIEDRVISNLRNQANKLGVLVPPDLYQKIEAQAVKAIKPKKDGGEGLTEQEVKRKYADELDQISRDYSSLGSFGGLSMFGSKPSTIQNSLSNLSNKFAKRDDSENFAETLISKNNLSPSRAYAQAYPVSRNKDLNYELKKIPSVDKLSQTMKSLKQRENIYSISEKLAKFLKEDPKASPLSIGYELEKKGYDPNIWLEYLKNNSEQLDLRPSQSRQLDRLDSFTGTLSDWWLNAFTGEK